MTHSCFLLLVVLALVCLPPMAIGQTPLSGDEVPLGIWSWQQDAMTTKTARGKLLSFCEEHGIGHVDQHVSIRRDGDVLQIQNADKLAMLAKEAAEKGITISALRGERTMFDANNHAKRLKEVSTLIEFNEGLPEGAALRGIKYDVEPYLTDAWKSGGDRRKTIMQDYCQCLSKIQRLLEQRESTMELCVDVPFWWDKAELGLELDGVRKPFVNHVQDRVDAVCIMSYRRSANDVVRLCEQELSYARTAGHAGVVGLGLNFRPATNEKVTTFADHPVSDYRRTLSELKDRLSGNRQVRCVMLHDYKSFSKYVIEE